MNSKSLSIKIAEDLHTWMSGLKSPDGSYAVDPHEFLPANVTCDFVGRMRFIREMAEKIEASLMGEQE